MRVFRTHKWPWVLAVSLRQLSRWVLPRRRPQQMRRKKLFLSLRRVYKLLTRQKGFRLVQTLDRSRCLRSRLLIGPRTKQLTSLRHLSTEKISRNFVVSRQPPNFDLANSCEFPASKLNAFWPVRVQGCGPVTRAFQSPRRDDSDLLSLVFFP